MGKQYATQFHSSAHKCSETGVKPQGVMTYAHFIGKNISTNITFFVVTTRDGWGTEMYITNDHVLMTQMSIMKEKGKQRKRSLVVTFRRE